MTTNEILAFRNKLLQEGFLPSLKPVDPENPLIAPPPEATREMQEYQLVVMLDCAYHLSLLTDRLHDYNAPVEPPQLPGPDKSRPPVPVRSAKTKQGETK
jgi:hypothetical protein